MSEFKPFPIIRLASDKTTNLWVAGEFVKDDMFFYPDAWKQPIANTTRDAIHAVMELGRKRS